MAEWKMSKVKKLWQNQASGVQDYSLRIPMQRARKRETLGKFWKIRDMLFLPLSCGVEKATESIEIHHEWMLRLLLWRKRLALSLKGREYTHDKWQQAEAQQLPCQPWNIHTVPPPPPFIDQVFVIHIHKNCLTSSLIHFRLMSFYLLKKVTFPLWDHHTHIRHTFSSMPTKGNLSWVHCLFILVLVNRAFKARRYLTTIKSFFYRHAKNNNKMQLKVKSFC